MGQEWDKAGQVFVPLKFLFETHTNLVGVGGLVAKTPAQWRALVLNLRGCHDGLCNI